MDQDRAARIAPMVPEITQPWMGPPPARMGAEEFAVLLKQCPGAFMLPGAGQDRAALHTTG